MAIHYPTNHTGDDFSLWSAFAQVRKLLVEAGVEAVMHVLQVLPTGSTTT